MNPRRRCLEAFRQRRVVAVDVIEATSGMHPLWFNWGLLFRRHRLLVLTSTPGELQEWSACGGPTPGVLLRSDMRPVIDISTSGFGYVAVRVAERRFWVRRRDITRLEAWVKSWDR